MGNQQEAELSQKKDQGISVLPSSALSDVYKSSHILRFHYYYSLCAYPIEPVCTGSGKLEPRFCFQWVSSMSP